MILTDANATMGAETSAAVGDCDAEPQNLCRDRFHDMLLELRSFLPATFVDHAHHTTWTANVGQGKHKHRLEYVALPIAWQNAVSKVSTITDIDLLNKVDDHHAQPSVTITYNSECNNFRNNWKSCAINSDKLRENPGALQTICNHIGSAQTDSWSVPIDQHAMHIHNVLSGAISVVAKGRGGYKQKSYLSDGTYTLVNTRRKSQSLCPSSLHKLMMHTSLPPSVFGTVCTAIMPNPLL